MGRTVRIAAVALRCRNNGGSAGAAAAKARRQECRTHSLRREYRSVFISRDNKGLGMQQDMRFVPGTADGTDVTGHLILNAHIETVWLWPWQSWMAEALATCRAACARRDQGSTKRRVGNGVGHKGRTQ